jgi:hypothetical protein
MDAAMEGSGSGKGRKTLSPLSEVSRGSVDCRLVCIRFRFFFVFAYCSCCIYWHWLSFLFFI